MSTLNASTDDVVECPLCMEPLEVDDLNFFPCTCGYQICRFCWHRIRTDENELCPACRKAYPENPADFTPLTQEEMIAFKSQKRQRDQQRRQKITENRKHLANVRVVQKNLVFVVGLPPRLADADILKKHEYFGKYGKIHKVVINPSTTYAGVQGPSASAYVTYINNSDALRAIQSVNNIMIDGRLIKTSLGTTKYCSHFMKNQQCPKSDCMYLHELGDSEASFTKEEMHQGKHQEYEKRLHDTLIATSVFNGNVNQAHSSSSSVNSVVQTQNFFRHSDNKALNNNDTPLSGPSVPTSSTLSSSSSTSSMTNGITGIIVNITGSNQQKEAWPSLSVSPVNKDVCGGGTALSGKNKKEKTKFEKSKNEKVPKTKNKNNHNTSKQNTSVANETIVVNSSNEEKDISILEGTSESALTTTEVCNTSSQNKIKPDKVKEKVYYEKPISHRTIKNVQSPQNREIVNLDNETKLLESEQKQNNENKYATNGITNKRYKENLSNNVESRSVGSNNINNSTECDIISPQHDSGNENVLKSNIIEGNFLCPDIEPFTIVPNDETNLAAMSKDLNSMGVKNTKNVVKSKPNSKENFAVDEANDNDVCIQINNNAEAINLPPFASQGNGLPYKKNIVDTTAALSKLDIFDDANSFFSSPGSTFQQSLLLRNKLSNDIRQSQENCIATSQLPDLLNGIDGFSNKSTTNEWEDALKDVMLRTSKQKDEHAQHQLQQHHYHARSEQEDELFRVNEFQNRKNIFNDTGKPQMNGSNVDFFNITTNFNGNIDNSRAAQVKFMQPQHSLTQTEPPTEPLENTLFGTNMSKFFDFHKNQQQQINQQFYINANGLGPLTDHLRIASFIENNRINSQLLDQTNNLALHQQQQQHLQHQRLKGQFSALQPQGTQQQNQQTGASNQFTQNLVDDDLGFDPFIETQKGLAELMENELQQNTIPVVRSTTPSLTTKLPQQQQQQFSQQYFDNLQRARMPPPGFNHMNVCDFGVSRPQNANKMPPFLSNGILAHNNHPKQNHHQMQIGNKWNPHMATFLQHPMNDYRAHQIPQNQNPNNGNHVTYSNNDWTAMDPAILSFRQFSSYPQRQQPSHHQLQQDVYIQQLPNQQQHNHHNFGAQANNTGNNIPNPLLNSPSPSQAQVNANVQGMLEYLKTRQYI